MKVEKILSGMEVDRLQFIAKDSVAIGALKKVILSAIYFDGTLVKEGIPDPLKNFCLAIASKPNIKNEDLGAEIRASLAAVQLLETGFKELEKFNVQQVEEKPVVNQAR